MIASIAVSAAVFAIDKPYSYLVPHDQVVQIGMRVIVPFGRGNRRSEGIVLDIKEGNDETLKSIEFVMDDQPIITEVQLRLAAFIRERYFCTFYDAIKAILPAGVWFQSKELIERSNKDFAKARISEFERELLEFFSECDSKSTRSDLKRLFMDAIGFDEAVDNLIRKGYLVSSSSFSRKVQDKAEKIVSLAVSAEQAAEYAEKRRKAAPVQYELLSLLCTVGSASAKELCYLTGATNHTINRLEKLGFVTCRTQEVLRTSLPVYTDPAEELVLNDEQQLAFEALSAQYHFEKPGVGVLYGVTGSGKTSVYIELIKEALKQGKSALYLVPEIALTPQLISKLMSYFGETVSVLHSALRVTERYDAWKKIKCGGSRVVIGTRSAVFAPLTDLGLIIVDEEHEHTYKSEMSPRYHAREIAIYRGSKENALVLLGSATPSVETMYLAKSGVYSLHKLEKRYNRQQLPLTEIVDMKQEIRSGNVSDVSSVLCDALRDNIQKGEQSILFLNRRGAGKSMICVSCGVVQQCPRCSVSLVYHKANGRLMCHHCGHSQPTPGCCPDCGGHLKIIGTGTQKIEQELKSLLGDVSILRMDADTISASNTHEMLLKRFCEEKISVLIGTQMVAKGLDFENVTLVGVIDADMSLYVNHYRAAETTFSMLTQVIGRSGRGAHNGHAIIQTMTPEHPVIRLAAKQDYDGFYDLECTMRKMQRTPPHGDVFSITVSSISEEAALNGAYYFKAYLQKMIADSPAHVLGPSPAPILKINHTYRYKITVLCGNKREFRLILASALKEFGKNKKYKGVAAYADINSYE